MALSVTLLLICLYRKLHGLDIALLLGESTKIGIAMSLSAVITYYIKKLLDNLIFDTTRTINVFLLLVTLLVAFFSMYIFFAWIMNVKEFSLIYKMLEKVKGYQKKFVEVYTNTISIN